MQHGHSQVEGGLDVMARVGRGAICVAADAAGRVPRLEGARPHTNSWLELGRLDMDGADGIFTWQSRNPRHHSWDVWLSRLW